MLAKVTKNGRNNKKKLEEAQKQNTDIVGSPQNTKCSFLLSSFIPGFKRQTQGILIKIFMLQLNKYQSIYHCLKLKY